MKTILEGGRGLGRESARKTCHVRSVCLMLSRRSWSTGSINEWWGAVEADRVDQVVDALGLGVDPARRTTAEAAPVAIIDAGDKVAMLGGVVVLLSRIIEAGERNKEDSSVNRVSVCSIDGITERTVGV